MLRPVGSFAVLLSLMLGLWAVGTPSARTYAAALETIDPEPAPLAWAWVPWLTPEQAPEWPDRCERLRFDPERDKIRRVRRRHTNADRREMRAWLAAVAAEFEPRDAQNFARFLQALASRESSYRPGAVHVLSPDRKAAERASSRVSGSDHPHARARVDVLTDSGTSAGLVRAWSISAWALSRGLYGQPSGLWLRSGGRWGADLPPWALCDRRVSTSLLVWAARDALRECRAYPATYRTLNRRISSGHCEPRALKFERQWTKRARDQGLDPDAPVRFDGKRWSEQDADRVALLRRLREFSEYGT